MIGGEHYFPVPATVPDSLGQLFQDRLGHLSLFASGRDALVTLLGSLPASHLYLPDLMCSSVHDAAGAAGKKPVIYKITPDFMHEADTAFDLPVPSVVFVMHYFGLRNDALMHRAKQAGHIVVSDVTHLLFDQDGLVETARQSDYLIASLRKSGPFPDGGFVSSLAHPVAPPRKGLRESFFALRTAGLMSRGFAAAQGFGDDENFVLLKQAEEALDASEPADFSCSYLSRRLLHVISVPSSADAIRRNTAVLSSGLKNLCKVPGRDLLSPYFPCLFESHEIRDQVRSALAARRFFFPVHWPATGQYPSSSLSARYLSIPCDARYNEHQMRASLEIIASCLPH